jgi:ech hydrogenase subunit D
MSQHTIQDLQVSDLLAKAQAMKADGQRLVQICCTKLTDSLELHYSFDKDFAFTSFRITLADTSTVIPSISKIYLCSFHYENEIHDLFGIQVEGNVVDYQGNFYRTAIKTPFNPAGDSQKSEVIGQKGQAS